MSYTKRQFIEGAFSEIGLANYNFDIQTEQMQDALRKMDTMVATWNAEGIRIGYPLPSSPEDSDIDQETGVFDRANEAIIQNLALKIASGLGRQVSQDLRTAANRAKRNLHDAKPNELQYPSDLPVGAGYKAVPNYSTNFFPTPDDPLQAGEDEPLDLE